MFSTRNIRRIHQQRAHNPLEESPHNNTAHNNEASYTDSASGTATISPDIKRHPTLWEKAK
jgi:hypothetical protein